MNHLLNQALIAKIQLTYTQIPLAVFLLGSNGSGKSTLRNYLNLSDIQTNIDPDLLNKIFKNKYPDSYILEAAKQALIMYKQGIKNGFNICIESTLAGHGTMLRIKEARESGYCVIGYLLGLDNVELNIKRIKKRVKNGGHGIDDDVVRRRYIESINNCIKIKNYFNELHIIDNSNDHYSLQLSKYEDKLTQHEANLVNWVKQIKPQLI